jgi:hypothetical protein
MPLAQARDLLVRASYLVVVVPIGLGSRRWRDPLRIRRPPARSNWRTLDPPGPPTLAQQP